MDTYRLAIVTFALMMGLFLASIEVTVVGTAMPTIIAQLGGLEIYSWIFSIYLLTSTTTVPLFGRLSDIYGRKPIYLFGVFMFLLGSGLSGQANSMPQLIAFRGVQGLGAGALMPMAFTIIGDIYTLEQRAKMQGVFAAIWGVSSVIGPLVGGFLVDNASWRWVFYLNIPFGLVAAALIAFVLDEPLEDRDDGGVDYVGAGLLMAGVLALLYALVQGGTVYAWSDWRVLALLLLAAGSLVTFVWVERRVANPLVPLDLFKDRLFATASAHGFLVGLTIFGAFAYIPLFVQGVLSTSATRAGATLTPMVLGWTIGSTVGGHLLLRIGPKRIAIVSMAISAIGAFLLTQLGVQSTQTLPLISMLLIGIGVGLTITSYLVSVQNRVSRRRLGIATSSLQFVRQIGGTIGVSLMGAVMAVRFTAGIDRLPESARVDPQTLLNSSNELQQLPPTVTDAFRELLATSLHPVFWIMFVTVLLAFATTFFTPRGSTQQLVAEGDREERTRPEPAVAP